MKYLSHFILLVHLFSSVNIVENTTLLHFNNSLLPNDYFSLYSVPSLIQCNNQKHGIRSKSEGKFKAYKPLKTVKINKKIGKNNANNKKKSHEIGIKKHNKHHVAQIDKFSFLTNDDEKNSNKSNDTDSKDETSDNNINNNVNEKKSTTDDASVTSEESTSETSSDMPSAGEKETDKHKSAHDNEEEDDDEEEEEEEESGDDGEQHKNNDNDASKESEKLDDKSQHDSNKDDTHAPIESPKKGDKIEAYIPSSTLPADQISPCNALDNDLGLDSTDSQNTQASTDNEKEKKTENNGEESGEEEEEGEDEE